MTMYHITEEKNVKAKLADEIYGRKQFPTFLAIIIISIYHTDE